MTKLSNILSRQLAVFPTENEALLYARQKLAEGVAARLAIVPLAVGFAVNLPGRLF